MDVNYSTQNYEKQFELNHIIHSALNHDIYE